MANEKPGRRLGPLPSNKFVPQSHICYAIYLNRRPETGYLTFNSGRDNRPSSLLNIGQRKRTTDEDTVRCDAVRYGYPAGNSRHTARLYGTVRNPGVWTTLE